MCSVRIVVSWELVGAPSRLVQFVAPVVIIVVVISVLLAAVHTSINQSAELRTSGQVSYWTDMDEQFQCLRVAFQHEVPKGSSVWIGNPESPNPITGVAAVTDPELATLWAVIAPRSSSAMGGIHSYWQRVLWTHAARGKTAMISYVVAPLLLLTLSALVPSIAVAGVRPVTIFLAPLFGGLMAGFAAECELALGGTFVAWFIIIGVLVNLVSVMILALRHPGDRKSQSRPAWQLLSIDVELRSPWPWITAIVIAGSVAWPLRALRVPIIGFDARAIWTLHSLFIYGGHHTYLGSLKNPVYAFSNPDYPPLVPASGAFGFVIHGGSDIHLAVSLTAILNACALGVAACGIASVPRKDASSWARAVAIGGGAAVCLIGFGVNEASAVGGQADLLWAASALAATIYGLLLPPSSSHLAIGWICATVAALTKNEGLTVALVILALMSIRYIPASSQRGVMHHGQPPDRSGVLVGRTLVRRFQLIVPSTAADWLTRASLWLAMAAPSLLWPLLMKYEGIGSDFFGSSSESVSQRFQPTISAVAHNLHILPVAAVVATVGGLTMRRTRLHTGIGGPVWIWIVIAWSLIALTATYVFGGLEIHWWLSTSVSRTTVFAQIALYTDMVVWMVIAADQVSSSAVRHSGGGRACPLATARADK